MYLSNEKNTSADNYRVQPTICFIEKISFSLKLFSGHFFGQTFIKTIRGPLIHEIVYARHFSTLCTAQFRRNHCASQQITYRAYQITSTFFDGIKWKSF